MNKEKLNSYIEAIDKFNEKHRKFKVYYSTIELGYFQFIIKNEEAGISVIKFRLPENNLKQINELIELLEDLRKDLTGSKK